MLKEETKQLMFLLETAYPRNYEKMSNQEKLNTMQLYYDFFGEYETSMVVAGLRNYIKSNQYPPTIAGLTEQIELLAPKHEDIDYWNLILKACRNSAYNSKEEFEKLPIECQRWVGSPTGLKELSQLDITTFNTVSKGQFLKSIPTIVKREQVKLTAPMQTLLEGEVQNE